MSNKASSIWFSVAFIHTLDIEVFILHVLSDEEHLLSTTYMTQIRVNSLSLL